MKLAEDNQSLPTELQTHIVLPNMHLEMTMSYTLSASTVGRGATVGLPLRPFYSHAYLACAGQAGIDEYELSAVHF